jgi:CRP-like cAMP-binding protein
LAVTLGFVDDLQTNRRSIMHKVPFCRGLSADDLIAICCRLKHCTYEPPLMYEDGSLDRSKFIMRQFERGREMWIILDGKVRVEAQQVDEKGVKGEINDLGKLGMSEFFGESAVLTEESPGVPLKRMRSVYAITQTVLTV